MAVILLSVCNINGLFVAYFYSKCSLKVIFLYFFVVENQKKNPGAPKSKKKLGGITLNKDFFGLRV
jgi:hypothetical protein